MSTSLTIEFSSSSPSEEEAAAITAAIAALFAENTVQTSQSLQVQASPWRDSGKLVHQGLAPLKLCRPPAWHTIERLRRHAKGGFYGVVGM